MEKNGKKERFMQETLKLVYDKGFGATTMRDIAKNSKFEVGNVYNYIDSKEAFLESHLFTMLQEFTGYLNDILDSSFSPREKLKYLISKHVQFTIRKPYQVALFVYDWRNLSEPKLTEFKQMKKDYLLKVGCILEEGMQMGEFRTMNLGMATLLVFSSLRWLFNFFIHEEKNHNPIELEKLILDYIFGGIDKRE